MNHHMFQLDTNDLLFVTRRWQELVESYRTVFVVIRFNEYGTQMRYCFLDVLLL